MAKRPTEETLRKVTLGYQSRSAFTGHADLGGHFDENKRFGYRVNGNDSNLLIVFYVQIMPDDLVMQLHRF